MHDLQHFLCFIPTSGLHPTDDLYPGPLFSLMVLKMLSDKAKNLLSFLGFPVGAVVNPPANTGDTGSIPGLGRSHMPRSN